MKFCPQCGAQNKDEAKFCVDCGADISNIITAPPGDAAPQATGQKNKWIAPILNFIGGMLIYGLSGIGHAIYLRLYKRAAIFAAIGFLLSAVYYILFIFNDSLALNIITTLLGIAFTIYAMYDAYKCSEAINEGRELPPLIGGIRPESLSTGMAAGAAVIALIVMILALVVFASSAAVTDASTAGLADDIAGNSIIGNDATSGSNDNDGVKIKISYPGEWSASIGDQDTSTSYNGNGDETIEIDDGQYDVIAAAVQKTDDSKDKLKVKIIRDGDTLDSESTSEEYGVVTVSATL